VEAEAAAHNQGDRTQRMAAPPHNARRMAQSTVIALQADLVRYVFD